VADALERAIDGRAAPPARIAHHHERAGHAARAAPFWHGAGEAALAALRFAEAAEAFERAAQGHGAAGRGDAAFASAYAMRQASFELDLGERSDAALALLERHAGTPAQRAQACNERAVTLLHRGDLGGCDAAAQAGLAALAGAEAPLLRAELRRNIAGVALWRQQTATALAELRAIEHDIERLAGGVQRAEFRQSLAIVLDHDDQAAVAQPEHERAMALFLAEGMVPAAAQVAANLAASHFDGGDPGAAWATLERARALLAAAPEAHRSYSSLSLNSGYVLTALGEYAQALDHFETAVVRAREQTPGWLPLVMAWRALLWLHLNQPARAGQDPAAAAPGETSPLLARARWVTVRAQWLHALHGPRPDAIEAIDALLAQLPPAGRRLTRWRLELARLPHLGDAEAAAAAHALLQQLQGHGRAGLEIVAAAERAERLLRLGDAAGAGRCAAATLERMATRTPDSVYRGRIWAQCLPALVAVGDARHAALRDAARGWIERTARQAVPEPFRDGFGPRHPAHRLLARG
jgi:tetratricopeptide (TPR) repeat protein